MVLGIYFELCIQGSQRAFKPGFAIFKATRGQDTQAKPPSIAYFGLSWFLHEVLRLSLWPYYVHKHTHYLQTLTC